jgi:protein-tyrosine phosphatase
MSSLFTLLSTTPESLAKLQYDSLKAHAIVVLQSALRNVTQDTPDKIKTFHSPAGDGYGRDNDCIDFAYPGTDEPLDIKEITEKLLHLKELTDHKKKGK